MADLKAGLSKPLGTSLWALEGDGHLRAQEIRLAPQGAVALSSRKTRSSGDFWEGHNG